MIIVVVVVVVVVVVSNGIFIKLFIDIINFITTS